MLADPPGAPAAPAASDQTSGRRSRGTPVPVRVVQVGLGPIGAAIARLVAQRPSLRLVGAVDVDPAKVGQPVAALLGLTGEAAVSAEVRIEAVADRVLQTARPDIVLHSTSSSLAMVRPQLEALLAARVPVISTCEELAYPAAGDPAAARHLDAVARANGVCLLGTGVNPGFVMDALPVACSTVCQRVDAVTVTRVVDAAARRLPLQRKIGAGLPLDEFRARVQAGTVRHVGLRESAHLLAAAFGWTLESYDEVIEPVVAERAVASADLSVQPGQAAGVRQTGRGVAGGRQVVTLNLRMEIQAADARDEIAIEGVPPVRVVVPGGIHGDTATAAVVVNAIPHVLAGAPGLRTVLDLPLGYRAAPRAGG